MLLFIYTYLRVVEAIYSAHTTSYSKNDINNQYVPRYRNCKRLVCDGLGGGGGGACVYLYSYRGSWKVFIVCRTIDMTCALVFFFFFFLSPTRPRHNPTSNPNSLSRYTCGYIFFTIISKACAL